jgi:polyisoprenoid-binding protein YceI
MLRRTLTAATALLFIPALALAAVEKFSVDPVHSQVSFTIRHLVSKVTGHFNQFEGDVMLDPADPSTMSITGKIMTASISTNNERRDGHLKSKDFFAADSFPEITFKSKSVAKAGDSWTVTGDLTMRGVTKEVPLNVQILGVSPAPIMGGIRVGLEATGKVNRKDFGVSWNSPVAGGMMLGDDVTLTINAEAVNKVDKPPVAAADKDKDKDKDKAKDKDAPKAKK